MISASSKTKWSASDLAHIALFSVLIAVCSWIAIPSAVPFTLQTFAVFLAVGLLGGKRGTVSVLVYLLLGTVGIPVFAGFGAGIGVLLGPTGGYLAGFLLSALIYWIITAYFGKKLPARIFAMALGLLACYAFGTVWFMAVYARTTGPISLVTALSWCVFPFLLPDCAKLALAAVLSSRLARYVR